MPKPAAHIVAVGSGKNEYTMYPDVCYIIGKQILPSVTDNRCQRRHAEITFRSEKNDALLTVV